jgi:signal transduction histidine kinase
MQENPWIKRFERERASRKEAEKLLESKSLELYEANLLLEERVKERTEQLESALHEAQVAQRAKDAFLSTMSHELRTPLNAIIGFSQILSHQEDVNPRTKMVIEKIKLSGEHLLHLLNSILNFTKFESETIMLQHEAINIKVFIEELLVTYKIKVKEKNISLHVEVDDLMIHADRQWLHEAISNLLSNAVKFTKENGKITISAQIDKDLVHISVSDTGIGIAQEDQKKLLTPFAHINNIHHTQIDGTGLGLYLTKKIIELHSGSMTFQSELGKGSTFTITLPYSEIK